VIIAPAAADAMQIHIITSSPQDSTTLPTAYNAGQFMIGNQTTNNFTAADVAAANLQAQAHKPVDTPATPRLHATHRGYCCICPCKNGAEGTCQQQRRHLRYRPSPEQGWGDEGIACSTPNQHQPNQILGLCCMRLLAFAILVQELALRAPKHKQSERNTHNSASSAIFAWTVKTHFHL
jgi:hypothetical protein